MQLLCVKTSGISLNLDKFWKVARFCWQPKNSLLAWNPCRIAGQFVMQDSYFIPFSALLKDNLKTVQQNKHKRNQNGTKSSPVSNISWNNRKLRNLEYFQRQYIWCTPIKGFNAVFGPAICIKAVCLCFDKTGATDFDINF